MQQQQVSQIKETLKLVCPLPFHDNILTELEKDMIDFAGDNFRYFSKNQYEYTKDKYTLDIITNGLKLDLKELPTRNIRPTYPLSSKENDVIPIEITKLLKRLVIVQSTPYEDEFISELIYFTRDKKEGNKRMILNLKKFYKFVNYKHFKMESINVINLIKPNVYMTSIDLKDAFSSIHNDHPKYLKFMFGNFFN